MTDEAVMRVGANQKLDRKLSQYLKDVQNCNAKDRPIVFEAGIQTQGFRWIDYWESSYTDERLTETLDELQNASTWSDAIRALTQLKGIGPYTAAQALCTLAFGVWNSNHHCDGRQGLFRNHNQVMQSTLDRTEVGPGPTMVLKHIFPYVSSPKESIIRLRNAIIPHLDQLGFAYLKASTGESSKAAGIVASRRQELSCLDLEHVLCCFHSYLVKIK